MDRQNHGQKKKGQKGKQRFTKHYKESKTSSCTRPTKTPGVNLCALEGLSGPAPLVIPFLLQLNDTIIIWCGINDNQTLTSNKKNKKNSMILV